MPIFNHGLSKSRQLTVLALLFLLFPHFLFAEPATKSFQFKTIHLSDAFTQKTVRAMAEDKTGFLWVASEEGLIRYDGSSSKPFRNNPDNPDSLNENVVSQLVVDNHNRLWVGTIGNGVSFFEPKTETFHAIDSAITGNYVQSLSLNSDGDILLGASKGVFVISAADFSVKRLLDVKQLNDATNVVGLWQAPNKTLWIATDHGYLFRFDASSGLVQMGGKHAENFSKLYYSDDYGLLIAAKKQGLLQLDILDANASGQLMPLFSNILNPKISVYDAVNSANGDLWIATNKGLFNHAKNKDTLLFFKSNPNDAHSLPQDDIRTLLYSKKQSLLWVGTKTKGLSVLNLTHYGFKTISPFLTLEIPLNVTASPNFKTLKPKINLDDSTIWSVFKDGQQGLWIGSNKGLNYQAKGQYSFTIINTLGSGDTAINIEDASAIAEANGLIWVGTWGMGVVAYSAKESTAIHYHNQALDLNHRLSGNTIRLLLYDAYRHCLWIGTKKNGLNRLDFKTGKLSVLKHSEGNPLSLPHNAIRALYIAPNHRLWVGTGKGLSRLNDDDKTFKSLLSITNNPKTLSDEDVRAIYQQGNNTLWVATGNGLNKVNINPFEVVQRLGEKQGLSNSTLYSLLPDAMGNLWISSNVGLSRFNPNTLAFNNFYNYHNLQDNEFNFNALFSDALSLKPFEQVLYFGGVNGVSYFTPSAITHNNTSSVPVILRFDAFDSNLQKRHLKNSITQSLKADESLELDASLRRIQFDFSSIEFIAPQFVRYRYRLNGFEEQWNAANINERRAVYTNLRHGSYTFELELVNESPANPQISIPFLIKPYFWETLWFKFFVGLLFILLLIAFWLSRERVITKKAVESERLHHYRKVVHELKTPLIHVKSLLGHLKNAANTQDDHELLSASQKNIKRSLSFLDQLHSVVKLNSNLIEEAHEFLLEELIDEALIPFLDEPENKKRISLLPYDSEQTVKTFEGSIYLILSNLISNALKYSAQDSPITIKISIDGCDLIIECIDRGKPLSKSIEDALYLAHTRFQTSDKTDGLGLGLTIIKKVISLHNGSIKLNHDYTQGNHFVVVLHDILVKEAYET